MANIIMIAHAVGNYTLADETLSRMHEVDKDSMLTVGLTMTKYYSIEHDPFKALKTLETYSGPESARINSIKLSMLVISGQYDAAAERVA